MILVVAEKILQSLYQKMMTNDQIETLYTKINFILPSIPSGEEILNGYKKINVSEYTKDQIVYMMNDCVKVFGRYFNGKVNILIKAKMNDLLNFLDQCDSETKLLTINMLVEYYNLNAASFIDKRWEAYYRQYRS